MDDSPKDPRNNRKKKLTIIFVVLGVVLILASISYLFLIQNNPNKDGDTTNNTSAAQSSGEKDGEVTENNYHTVLSEGYPFNKTETKLVIKLAVPNRLQSIKISSTIQDPGLTDFLANKFNEEMGRWKFDDPNTPGDVIGDISIIHIGNDWLNENNDMELVYGGSSSLSEYPLKTTADKQASIAKLKTDTTECVKDTNNGFIISDFLNVCYKIWHTPQAVDVYSPYMTVTGIGVHDNESYVMTGYISLENTKAVTTDEANKLTAEFAAGTIPKQTLDIAREYTQAFAKSSIEFISR